MGGRGGSGRWGAGARAAPEWAGSGRPLRIRGLVLVRSRLGVRKKGEQPIGGLAVLAGGAHDRAVIFAQHLEPRADVVRVADRRDDAERSAAEGRVHTGYEFLERVLIRAESDGLLPIQQDGVAAGVPPL